MITPKMSIRRRKSSCVDSRFVVLAFLSLQHSSIVTTAVASSRCCFKVYEDIINGMYQGDIKAGGYLSDSQHLEAA